MRDLIVFGLFVVVLPISFLRPWVGLCAFTWLAYNRTQDLTWGFARTLPISQFLAIALILGWIFWEFRPPPLRDKRVIAMLLMVAWVTLSLVMNPVRWVVQGDKFVDLAKVILITLITGALCVNRMRLRQLMAVCALGLGFFGFKNGLLLLVGSRTIRGPGGMMIDNNDLGLAMCMNIPLLWYLADEMRPLPYGEHIRKFMKATAGITLLAVVSTGSRGAFLTMSLVLFLIALKSKWKVPAISGMLLLGVLGMTFAPASYKERIASIFAEEKDASIQGRFTSWLVAKNMIQAKPLFGIGFSNMVLEYNNYTEGIYNEQGTTDHYARVSHNSYLQIWAESGTPAYLAFMFMLVSTIIGLDVFRRRVAREPEDAWIIPYCQAIQVSLCGFMLGATFLNRAHFDLTYTLVIATATFPQVLANERRVQRKVRMRKGPRVAQEVWVRHRDPFVKIGNR